MVKHGFINQKLGKRNSRRNALLKSKADARPSWPKSLASKPLDSRRKPHKP